MDVEESIRANPMDGVVLLWMRQNDTLIGYGCMQCGLTQHRRFGWTYAYRTIQGQKHQHLGYLAI